MNDKCCERNHSAIISLNLGPCYLFTTRFLLTTLTYNFYVFMNITREMPYKWKFISSAKYHNKHPALHILHISAYLSTYLCCFWSVRICFVFFFFFFFGYYFWLQKVAKGNEWFSKYYFSKFLPICDYPFAINKHMELSPSLLMSQSRFYNTTVSHCIRIY